MQNPHPLVVHFPLALLLTSVVAALYAAARGAGAVSSFARALLWLGTAACAAAVITGFLASQSVAPVKAAAGVLHEHQNFAYVLLALAATLSGWSFVAWSRTRATPRPTPLWVAGQLALAVLLVLTGRDGGRLVHTYGVGTALTAPTGPLHETPAKATTAPPSPNSPAAPPRPAGSDFH